MKEGSLFHQAKGVVETGNAGLHTTSGNHLIVSCIETMRGVSELRPEWEELSRRDPESGLFLSYPWIARLLNANPGQWHVYTVRTGTPEQRLVCLFPVSVKARDVGKGPASDVRMGAAGRFTLGDRTGFLCDPAYVEKGLSALARHMAAGGWSRLSLRYEPTHRRSHVFAEAFDPDRYRVSWKEFFINDGQTNYLVSPTIDLPSSFDAYLSGSLGSQTRRSMRRALRNHIESGECRITTSTDETLERDLGILAELWSAQWAERYDERALARSVRQHGRYYRMAHELGAFRLTILWREARPIGAQACIVDEMNGDLIAKQGARSLGESLPIGNLLLLNETRWAIENGLVRFDLGHGDAPYKYSLGARDRVTLYFSIRPRSGTRGQAQASRI